jgi:hypothetical protein
MRRAESVRRTLKSSVISLDDFSRLLGIDTAKEACLESYPTFRSQAWKSLKVDWADAFRKKYRSVRVSESGVQGRLSEDIARWGKGVGGTTILY